MPQRVLSWLFLPQFVILPGFTKSQLVCQPDCMLSSPLSQDKSKCIRISPGKYKTWRRERCKGSTTCQPLPTSGPVSEKHKMFSAGRGLSSGPSCAHRTVHPSCVPGSLSLPWEQMGCSHRCLCAFQNKTCWLCSHIYQIYQQEGATTPHQPFLVFQQSMQKSLTVKKKKKSLTVSVPVCTKNDMPGRHCGKYIICIISFDLLNNL